MDDPMAQRPEDRELLAAAAAIGRDLMRPDPRIYWADLLLTAIVAYASLAGMMRLPLGGATIVLGLVAMLAFYRGLSFIHELAHLRRSQLPGFAAAWNLLFGIPLLTPSFLYDDVHVRHHARPIYGTTRDPEYLPLALMRPQHLVLFLMAAGLAPLGLMIRFGLLAPLGIGSARLRRATVARYSALAINPAFRRTEPQGQARREWLRLEIAAAAWAIAVILLVATGTVGMTQAGLALLLGSGLAVINQFRTLVAHLWENEAGTPMSLTAQYLDSVNVPPPALLPALWAPVGLRYHALHHLLPSVPYHALATAHRRLSARLGRTPERARVDHRNMLAPLRAIFRATGR